MHRRRWPAHRARVARDPVGRPREGRTGTGTTTRSHREGLDRRPPNSTGRAPSALLPRSRAPSPGSTTSHRGTSVPHPRPSPGRSNGIPRVSQPGHREKPSPPVPLPWRHLSTRLNENPVAIRFKARGCSAEISGWRVTPMFRLGDPAFRLGEFTLALVHSPSRRSPLCCCVRSCVRGVGPHRRQWMRVPSPANTWRCRLGRETNTVGERAE